MHNDFDPITEMSMGIDPSDNIDKPKKLNEKRKQKRKYSDEIWLSDQEELNDNVKKVSKSENDPNKRSTKDSKRKRPKSPKAEKEKIKKPVSDVISEKEYKPKEYKRKMSQALVNFQEIHKEYIDQIKKK